MRALAWYGADPGRLRWVRIGAGRTRPGVSCRAAVWAQASGYVDWLVSAPMPWPWVGLCPAGTAHAVVAAWRGESGAWIVTGSGADAARPEGRSGQERAPRCSARAARRARRLCRRTDIITVREWVSFYLTYWRSRQAAARDRARAAEAARRRTRAAVEVGGSS